MAVKINTPRYAIARYGPTWRREDIYSSDWGPVGREKCFLILFSFPAAAPPSLSPNTKQVQLQLLQLTIHSELINIWAGRPVLPGLVLRWLSLYCSPVTIISASHWSVLALVTPVWPLIGWQGVVSPGEAGYLIISWFVVFIIFYYQMLKLQVIFQAAIISVNHAQFRWLALFASNNPGTTEKTYYYSSCSFCPPCSSTRPIVGVGYITDLSPRSSKIVWNKSQF